MIKTLEQLKNSGFSVVVKEWYDKINNNTYHNVKIYINNNTYYAGFIYGYERQYIDTTLNYLYKNKIVEKNKDMQDQQVRWYIEKQASIYDVKTERLCRNNNF